MGYTPTGFSCEYTSLYAYNKLAGFQEITKEKLTHSKIVHADETGINVNGKLAWVHVNSNK